MKSLYHYTMIIILPFFLSSACDKDNPVEAHENHNDAEGVILMIDETVIVRIEEGEVKSGEVSVKTGQTTKAITVFFLDHDGDPFIPAEEASSLYVDIDDKEIAGQANVAGQPWQFTVIGKKTGTTQLELKLLHGDHADFTAPPVPVKVTE